MIDFLNKHIFRRKILKKKKIHEKCINIKDQKRHLTTYMNRESSLEDGTFINMYSYLLFLNINTLSSSKNIRTYFAFRLYSD